MEYIAKIHFCWDVPAQKETQDTSSLRVTPTRGIQSEVNKFRKKCCQLAGPCLFVRSKWHTKEKNVAIVDIDWLADQEALRCQFKLAMVISTNPDMSENVRDVQDRTFPSYPVEIKKPTKEDSGRRTVKAGGKITIKIPCTILHRDVRRLVLVVPVEEQQTGDKQPRQALCDLIGLWDRSSSGRCAVRF